MFSGPEGRGIGGSGDANTMALLCVFAIPVMVYWAVHARTAGSRMAGLLLALLLIFGVVSTLSRAGFLILIVVLTLTLLQYRKYFKLKSLGLIVAISGFGLLSLVMLIPEEFFERQATLVSDNSQDKSLDRRSSYVKVAIDAIEDRPLIGWGTDVFKKVWVRSEETRWFKMEERPAHNTYLEVAVGSGFTGLIIFLLLMAQTYFNFHSAEKAIDESRFRGSGDAVCCL